MTDSGSNRLPVLRAAASEAHRDVGRYLHRAAERALEAGVALVEAKGLVGHGQWSPWLAEAGIPARSASRYMALARSGMNSAIVADIGIAAAARAATEAERSIPAEGMAVEIVRHESSPEVGILELFWREGGSVRFCSAAWFPDRPAVGFSRLVPSWLVALFVSSPIDMDHLARRELPQAEAEKTWSEIVADPQA
jgi:hypothetical protein